MRRFSTFYFLSLLIFCNILQSTYFAQTSESMSAKLSIWFHNLTNIRHFLPLQNILCLGSLGDYPAFNHSEDYVRFNIQLSVTKTITHPFFRLLRLDEKYSIIHVLDMLVSPIREFSDGLSYYVIDNFTAAYLFRIDVPFVGSYESVVVGLERTPNYYGDVLKIGMNLILIPDDIKSKSSLLITPYGLDEVIKEIFSLLGFKMYIVVPKDNFIFARNIYMIINKHISTYNANQIFYKFKEAIIEKLGYLGTDAFRYVIFTRQKYRSRYIKNYKEIYLRCQQDFKDKKWDIYPPMFENFSVTVLRFLEIKFFVGTVGSNSCNLIFSNNNVGAVFFCSKRWDYVFIITYINRVYTEIIMTDSFAHYGRFGIYFPYNIAKNAIENVMYALDNKRWKNELDTSLYTRFSGTLGHYYKNLSDVPHCN